MLTELFWWRILAEAAPLMGKGPRPSSHTSAQPQSVSSKTSLIRKRRHVIRTCTKHKDHSHFYPVTHLGLEHIPASVSRAEDILKTVRHLARWVVRVRVRKVNPPRTGKESRATLGRSGPVARTCTGLATSVGKDYVNVIVPSHAVRDSIEACHTTADFFYDDSDDDSNVITVRGLSLKHHDFDQTAQLTCRTSRQLAHRFQSQEKTTATNHMLTESVKLDCVQEAGGDGVVALISHPHGFSKRVTFGSVCGIDVVNKSEEDLDIPSTFSVLSESSHSNMMESSPLLLSSPTPSSSFKSLLGPSSAVPNSESSSSSCCSLSSLSSLQSSDSGISSVPSSSSSSHSSKLAEETSMNVTTQAIEARTATVSSTGAQMSGVVSLCSMITEGIRGLCRRLLGIALTPSDATVRLSHQAPTCQGSSGGAVLLIGQRVWAGLQQKLMSLSMTPLPVFMHIGVLEEGRAGVAVPVGINGPSLCLFCG